jgi:hypothetical protein
MPPTALACPGRPYGRGNRPDLFGWVLVWARNPVVIRYLADTGFRLDYQADGVAVYRPA